MDRLVETTYLEMTHAHDATPYEGPRRLELRRAGLPSPELNRFFYATVGASWWWYSRLEWTRAQWLDVIDREGFETWVAYLSGTPAGYFELDGTQAGAVELVHFGLLPAFLGQGLGRELLAAAVERAWSREPERVWLHTCSLDHPRALPNYRAQGFRAYRTEEEIERLPDEPPTLWPET